LFCLLGSRNSTSHIRFDSEESDEETVEEQQEVCSTKDITDDFNSTPPSSNISASEQNHQASSEKAASECKVMQNLCDDCDNISMSNHFYDHKVCVYGSNKGSFRESCKILEDL